MDAIQQDQNCTLHTAPGLLFVHNGNPGLAPKLNCSSKLVGDARATVILSPAKLKTKAVVADWDDTIKDIGLGHKVANVLSRHQGLHSRRISSHGHEDDKHMPRTEEELKELRAAGQLPELTRPPQL